MSDRLEPSRRVVQVSSRCEHAGPGRGKRVTYGSSRKAAVQCSEALNIKLAHAWDEAVPAFGSAFYAWKRYTVWWSREGLQISVLDELGHGYVEVLC